MPRTASTARRLMKIGRASCRERVQIRDADVTGVQTCALPISGGQSGCAYGLRRLYLERGHEVRCPGLRHTGICESRAGGRAACTTLWPAVSQFERECLELRRRPGGL